MEQYYYFMVIALALLAILDLMVGVSNDAVNFLNSALGSKAISFRTVMIVASIGIMLGAFSSSGMMEVARKGIFVPDQFVFSEIIVIFMAVMITDVLLLDFFNTLGMPTSTTVSIVFELLGAAFAMAIIKIMANDSMDMGDLGSFLNGDNALLIISGILLSVAIAFTVGAGVQLLSRTLISFRYKDQPKVIEILFGGVATTAIIYFILIKGLKSADFISADIRSMVTEQSGLFLLANFVLWMLVSALVKLLFRANIYRLIIVLGTFALAMAFAGNDLVNFIGVSVAAYSAYDLASSSGVDPTQFVMSGLSEKVPTPPIFLLVAGLIMILTLWFSTKARYVTETEINLARDGEGEERFQPNYLSRLIVRFSATTVESVGALFPTPVNQLVNRRFKKPDIPYPEMMKKDPPAFDMVRASVNLMVASILISIATSMKLPLSTTYVTFMVAMGTSLADRAWGKESAVYRVAGVLNVIGGWFLTAIIAFVAAAAVAAIVHYGGPIALGVLLVLALLLLGRNFLSHRKQSKKIIVDQNLNKTVSSSIKGVMNESADNISNVIRRSRKIFNGTIEGLARQNMDWLKKSQKGVEKLTKEIGYLKDNVFYFIKNLEEDSVAPASTFYLNLLGLLQDMAQSLEYINKISYTHVHNNHNKLKYNQIKELRELSQSLSNLFTQSSRLFEEQDFESIGKLITDKQSYLDLVSEKIEHQVEATRTEEQSPKNTNLYFSILTETRELIATLIKILELYYREHDDSVEPLDIGTDPEPRA